MKLKFTSAVSQSEIDRRLANLRSYTEQATDAAIADMVDGHNPMTDAMGTDAEVAARAVVDMVSAAVKAEKIVVAKVAADAVADLYSAGQTASEPLVRMIAYALPDTGNRTRARRDARYRVTMEDGTPLVDNTTHPLADGAAVLWMLHGLPDYAPVSLRFAGMVYDRHGPLKLKAAAAHGIKRLEDRTRLRDLKEFAA